MNFVDSLIIYVLTIYYFFTMYIILLTRSELVIIICSNYKL